MPALVEQEADFQAEAPATLRAAEGPLTGVGSPVAGEAGLVSKALGAVRTGERALSAVMDPQVVGESRRVSESSGTVRAGRGRLTGRGLGVAAELGLLRKVLRALGTGQGVLTSMAALVGQQHVLAEALATMVA